MIFSTQRAIYKLNFSSLVVETIKILTFAPKSIFLHTSPLLIFFPATSFALTAAFLQLFLMLKNRPSIPIFETGHQPVLYAISAKAFFSNKDKRFRCATFMLETQFYVLIRQTILWLSCFTNPYREYKWASLWLFGNACHILQWLMYTTLSRNIPQKGTKGTNWKKFK